MRKNDNIEEILDFVKNNNSIKDEILFYFQLNSDDILSGRELNYGNIDEVEDLGLEEESITFEDDYEFEYNDRNRIKKISISFSIKAEADVFVSYGSDPSESGGGSVKIKIYFGGIATINFDCENRTRDIDATGILVTHNSCDIEEIEQEFNDYGDEY
jgi:hypothetical protein